MKSNDQQRMTSHGAEEPDAGTPEAVKEAEVSKTAAKEKLSRVRGRGVDWVRPSDLLARGGGALSRHGIDLTAGGTRRLRSSIKSGARWTAERARRLPPVSAFGRRGAAEQGPRRAGVGMR